MKRSNRKEASLEGMTQREFNRLVGTADTYRPTLQEVIDSDPDFSANAKATLEASRFHDIGSNQTTQERRTCYQIYCKMAGKSEEGKHRTAEVAIRIVDLCLRQRIEQSEGRTRAGEASITISTCALRQLAREYSAVVGRHFTHCVDVLGLSKENQVKQSVLFEDGHEYALFCHQLAQVNASVSRTRYEVC